ncbi:ABC transporter ATP-binding protein [Nostoc sp. FACHB-280]|uniref:ABC transporter ATP-binding protein n=1 Tax=Nostoc sp. FACHB-280 TaxID=2692839 RepID=UPI00168B1282|nr:ABC transporter ATP-binding protein [Nostoc sp. FACHB-280]MBD2498571.1 ABC transporter ATP-binding protein [Nostoc sp. FACHB-280]
MSVPTISTHNLSISYWSKNKRIEALQNVSLTINAGEFVSLIGPSGCGKSTLLNVIAGLINSGTEVNGSFNISGIKEIGYLFQKQTLLPWRTVIDNVTAPLEIRGVSRHERRKIALAMLEKYGLSGFENSFPRELSGGMQQRVLLIRTLIYQPDVVLLDEPLSSLDAQTRAIVQDEFLRVWRDTGCTFVLVTHDLDEAIALSQRVFLLSARPGKIVKEFQIDLPPERSAIAIRTDPKFQQIQREMWSELTTQVLQPDRGISLLKT